MQQKQPVPSYYYSASEWNRLGCGPLPSERTREFLKTIERSVPNKTDAGKGYN